MNPRSTLIAGILLAACLPLSAADWYGEPLADAADALSVAELMADPEVHVGQPLVLAGRITDVCTHRGCWAVFESDGEMIRVNARDHSFALPSEFRGTGLAHGLFERVDGEAGEEPQYRLVAEGIRLE